MNLEIARATLKEIVEDHDNVFFRTDDQIYIAGREPEEWKPKTKSSRVYTRKPQRWKDITKP